MEAEEHIDAVKGSLKEVRDGLGLNEAEAQAVAAELTALEEMLDKLNEGVVEIAVFGEVGSGKSSLLNALLGETTFETGARHGVTTSKGKREWIRPEFTSKGLGDSKVVLVDTPGINEVDGEERAEIAKETIRDSDLILFVVKGDLNDVEFQAIKELNELNKPIIVAFNKVDTHSTEQKKEVFDAINEKLEGIVKSENILFTAGNPIERDVEIERPDGSVESVKRKPNPIIEDLQDRILDILHAEGKDIIALNAALFASGISDRITAKKINFRRGYANDLIKLYAACKGAALALNPAPLLDLVGGMAVDAKMVHGIGKVYGEKLTFKDGQDVLIQVTKSTFFLSVIEGMTSGVASFLKIPTWGTSTIYFGLPQGLVGGYCSFIVGSVCHEYFANGSSWGEKGVKKTVEEILANTNKSSILSELKTGIKTLLKDKTLMKKLLSQKVKGPVGNSLYKDIFHSVKDNATKAYNKAKEYMPKG